MAGYEQIVEEEVMRITLNAILRAVFGAALEELRDLLPTMVLKSSRFAVLPPTTRRDPGAWSPWGRVVRLRRRYDAIIAGMIADARRDTGQGQRRDVLALLLQAR
jgi:cytochrome P450